MSNESPELPPEAPANSLEAINIKSINIDKHLFPIPSIELAPNSQFWQSINVKIDAQLANDRNAFREMLAREVPSSVAPPPLTESDKALQKLRDMIINDKPVFDPSIQIRRP
jgi:hypothetical protein